MAALPVEVVESLVSYASASWWERCCLFAIAARTQPSDLKPYRHAFIDLDYYGTGAISKADIRRGLAGHLRLFSSLRGGVDAFFQAADLDRSGTLSFLEFAAACLHTSLSPLDGWLAEEAFEAMDKDNDGLLAAEDVRNMFGELPVGLQSRYFGIQEWTRCILSCSPPPQVAPQRKQQTTNGVFASVFPSCTCADAAFRDRENDDEYKPIRQFSSFQDVHIDFQIEDWSRAKHDHLYGGGPQMTGQSLFFSTLPSSSPPYIPKNSAAANWIQAH